MRRLLSKLGMVVAAGFFVWASVAIADGPVGSKASYLLGKMFNAHGNFALLNYSTAPFTCTTTDKGATYYDTGADAVKVCTGSSWSSSVASATPTPQPSPTVVPRCRVLYSTGATATTTGTTAQDLYAYTLPGGTLKADGDWVTIEMSGSKANNNNANTELISFDGTTCETTGSMNANQSFVSQCRVTYRDATHGAYRGWTILATFVGEHVNTLSTTFSGNIAIKATVTTGAQAGDVTLNSFNVSGCIQ